MANILITGTNRGLGLEFVKQFATFLKTPSNLFALCREPDKAKELQDIASNNSHVHIIKADVRNHHLYKDIVKEVKQYIKDDGLHLLINNAGVMFKDDLCDITSNNLMNCLEVNVAAPLMFTKAFIPLLKDADSTMSLVKVGKSLVINMSSQLGSIEENTIGGYVSYRISKAALNMVTRSLAVDLEKYNIFVMAFHPGWVKTAMGGPDAPLSPEASIKGMLAALPNIQECHRGVMLNYRAKQIPW